MATVNFRQLSTSDAEQVLAEIWNCLEEYDIPSPRMSFVFLDGEAVHLACHFADTLCAQLVALRLSTWVASGDRAASRGGGSGAVPYSFFAGRRPIAPRGASHLAAAASLSHAGALRAR